MPTGAMNPTTWYILGIAAAVLAVATFCYITIVWRKAPRASRAMRWVAAASLTTGVLIGMLADHATTDLAGKVSGGPFGLWGANPCAPDGLPAVELGKEIVLTNQQHAGDPNWVDMTAAGPLLCSVPGIKPEDDPECEAFFLGTHALGLSLNHGDTRKCIPYQEVAAICGDGSLPKDSAFCKQAFYFQRQKMSR